MVYVDGLRYVGNMVVEALIEESRRISIFQRISTFIRELLERRRFACPSGAPSNLIIT